MEATKMALPSEILALIPARGGSKGIPRKNILPLAGKPLLAHTIKQALDTPVITRTVVSTNDDEIAVVAQQYGAEVVWRPEEISGDKATSESALLHTLDYLRDTEGYQPDLVVFLQATSPMRRPDDIQNAIDTFQCENADSLLSVMPFHGFLWRKEAEGVRSLSFDYRNRPMRQDAPEDYVENGSIYIFKPEILRQNNNRLGGKIAIYPMRALDSFQIDEPDDLRLIEQLMTAQPRSIPILHDIELLVLDFDGVLTDNRVLVDQDGCEAVMAHRGDGWGIARLQEAGVEVVVISTETNPVVAARCRKLKIDYIQSENNKIAALQRLAQERQLSPTNIAFVGNDVNDLDCLKWVGTPIVVADAMPEVLSVAAYITETRGGYGAVREVADAILRGRVTHDQ